MRVSQPKGCSDKMGTGRTSPSGVQGELSFATDHSSASKMVRPHLLRVVQYHSSKRRAEVEMIRELSRLRQVRSPALEKRLRVREFFAEQPATDTSSSSIFASYND